MATRLILGLYRTNKIVLRIRNTDKVIGEISLDHDKGPNRAYLTLELPEEISVIREPINEIERT